MARRLTIGKVAQLSGVAVDTIRFYERKGLLDRPPRSASGYRLYSEESVRRLKFIKKARRLGFSLSEIKELLELRIEPGTTCGEIYERARAKIGEIEAKIASLERMREVLTRLLSVCPAEGPLSRCPILEALELDPEAAPDSITKHNAGREVPRHGGSPEMNSKDEER